MKKYIVGICCLALALVPPRAGLSQSMLKTLSVQNLSVQVSLDHNVAGQPVLVETFLTNDPDHHSVYCASGFLDLHYTLRDASGHIVPADKEPWKHSGDGFPSTLVANKPNAPDPCKTLKVAKVQRRVLLSAFYPDVPHGTYTLEIELTPRGAFGTDTTGPITVTL